MTVDFARDSFKNGTFIVPKRIDAITPSYVENLLAFVSENNIELNSIAFEEGSKLEFVRMYAFAKQDVIKSIDFSNCKMLSMVDYNAFKNATAIESICFSGCENLKFVAYNAFKGCDAVKKIDFSYCKSIFNFDEHFWSLENLKEVNFSSCVSLERLDSNKLFIGCENLELVDLSNCTELKTFTNGLFKNLPKLKTVDFTNCKELKSISLNAFENCHSLENVVLEGCTSLEALERQAFKNCTALKSLNLSVCENLDKITCECFANCSNLEEVNVQGLKNLSCIKDGAFYLSGINSFTAPKGKDVKELTIEEGAFSSCNNLTKVDFKNSGLTTIGTGAFYHCDNLKDVSFKDSTLNSLGNAFIGCNLDLIDFRGVKSCENWRTAKINTTLALLSDDMKSYNYLSCHRLFSKATEVGLFNGDKCEETFKNDKDEMHHMRIGGFYLRKMAKAKNVDLPIALLRVILSPKELAPLLDAKVYQTYKNMITALLENGEKVSFDSSVVALFRALGYFGFEDCKTGEVDNAKVTEYKKLLARDYVKSKIKVNLNAETNKDYINKLINEKVLKVARSNSLQALVSNFVINNIAKNPHKAEIISFTECVKWDNTKNIDLAQFVVANFDEIVEKKIAGKNFKDFEYNADYDFEEGKNGSSIFAILENFDKVMRTTNKKIITRSNNQRLKLADLENATIYKGVTEENEQLAMYCGNAHISQKGFEYLADLFAKGKSVKDSQVLKVCEDNPNNAITYKLLEKDDPLGLVIGNITNCCQRYGSAGEFCLAVGATDVNSGFVVFYKGNEILGQGWVWYDPETQSFAIDNIEVPQTKLQAVNKTYKAEVLNCVQRFCDNAVTTMNKNGTPVKNVVIGNANTKIDALKDVYHCESDFDKMIKLPSFIDDGSTKVYTDIAKAGQFVVYRDGRRFNIDMDKLDSNTSEKEEGMNLG